MALKMVEFRRGSAVEGGALLVLDAFDGIHLGHVALIAEGRARAAELGIPLAVLSFEPNPRRLLTPRSPPFALLTRDQETRILQRLGVDILYILTFDFDVAAMDHASFSSEVLRSSLSAKGVVISQRFAYGRGREGASQDLEAEGRRNGFEVKVVEPARDAAGAVITSTIIRNRLADGRMQEAAAQLGRNFAIEGVVQHGAKLGRTIGFPTANIPLGDYIRLPAGIYAAVSTLDYGRRVPSLAYIGRRPTVDNGEERLEVFLYDFDENLYGRRIETEFLELLRPDQQFDSLAAMKAQMEVDRRRGREAIAAAAAL